MSFTSVCVFRVSGNDKGKSSPTLSYALNNNNIFHTKILDTKSPD